jgi:hypothetical protein
MENLEATEKGFDEDLCFTDFNKTREKLTNL